MLIGGRLFWLQTFRHEKLSKKASREFNRTVAEMGPRGRIFGAGGEVLAESITTWDAALMKRELVAEGERLKDPGYAERAVTKLCRALSLPSSFRKKYRRAKSYVSMKKGLNRSDYEAVKALGLKGVVLTPVQRRYYPSGNLARNIIGVTRQDKGLTGVELLYDKVLSGKVSRREIIRDAAGRVIFQDNKGAEARPRDLHLTIDKNIQYFAQEAVRKAVESYEADLGMALVQEPDTGRILAMTSWPRDLEHIESVEVVYEPGSTFKSITLSAALERGTVDERDTFYCENGAWAFTKRIILHDHEPEKTLTLSQVIERSSNIGTAKIGIKLGLKDFYLFTKAFGFGARSGLGFRGESAGLLRPLERFKPIDLAVASYGHGIAATPLQVVNAYSAIANGGELHGPRLVEKITEHDGKEIFTNEATVLRRVISEKTSRRVKAILRAVVENGTGGNADIPGYSIAGKTGTSNKLDPKTGRYMPGKNVASFAGFFPLEEPMYTILVVIDNPKKARYGGEAAAPPFREIAGKIINLRGIKPDVDIESRPAPRRRVSD